MTPRQVTVRPGVVSGRLRAPPSKSYTHRAIVAGHLADRTYVLLRPLDADDTRATARAVGRLGSSVRRARDRWTVRPKRPASRPRPTTVDCGESGTTLRLTAALAARRSAPVTFVGRGRLADRPMRPLWEALANLGATFPAGVGRRLPMTLRGPLHGGRVSLRASESSQFASALLLVLPTLAEDSDLTLVGDLVSRPYLEATLAVLAFHGVRVHRRGRRFRIPGGQRYRRARFAVPGDASSAAYFWTAAAVTGGQVRIDDVPPTWPQADLAILDLLERAGALVSRLPHGATVSGGELRPFEVDLTDSPDLYPLAGVLASAIRGTSAIHGAEHVAAKESDRRTGTARLARAMGARVRSTARRLTIRGTGTIRPFAWRGEGDHRMVMSAAVGALASRGPCRIEDAESVRKSYQGFWTDLDRVVEGGTTA